MFAREAGYQAMRLQRSLEQVDVKERGEAVTASNIVTEADERIGRFAEEFFAEAFPGCLVIQEETVEQLDTSGLSPETLVFIVDPIDGTLFYASGSFAWAISVGCFHAWEPVASCINVPSLQKMYYTKQGKSRLNGREIHAEYPAAALKKAVMLRHIKAYHDIDDFPGYTMSYGSVALHLALIAEGFACGCVTSKHRFYDVAGGVKLLENAGAELRYVNGGKPDWKALIVEPAQRAPDFFFACPTGAFDELAKFVKPKIDPTR